VKVLVGVFSITKTAVEELTFYPFFNGCVMKRVMSRRDRLSAPVPLFPPFIIIFSHLALRPPGVSHVRHVSSCNWSPVVVKPHLKRGCGFRWSPKYPKPKLRNYETRLSETPVVPLARRGRGRPVLVVFTYKKNGNFW